MDHSLLIGIHIPTADEGGDGGSGDASGDDDGGDGDGGGQQQQQQQQQQQHKAPLSRRQNSAEETVAAKSKWRSAKVKVSSVIEFQRTHAFSTFEEMIAHPNEEQFSNNHDRKHGGGLAAVLRTPMPDGSSHDLKVYIFAGIIGKEPKKRGRKKKQPT